MKLTTADRDFLRKVRQGWIVRSVTGVHDLETGHAADSRAERLARFITFDASNLGDFHDRPYRLTESGRDALEAKS